MTATIGADYSGKVIYLACLDGNTFKATANIDITNLEASLDALRTVLRLYRDNYGAVGKIWIEQPWVNGKHFPRSGLMLTRTATILEVVATEENLEVAFIHPLAWRKAVYGEVKPNNPKERALKYAQESFGYEVRFKNQHNTAEALCIAAYGQLELKNKICPESE